MRYKEIVTKNLIKTNSECERLKIGSVCSPFVRKILGIFVDAISDICQYIKTHMSCEFQRNCFEEFKTHNDKCEIDKKLVTFVRNL